MQALLGIDLGTTGVKAALFAAEDGRMSCPTLLSITHYFTRILAGQSRSPQIGGRRQLPRFVPVLQRLHNTMCSPRMYVALVFLVRCMALCYLTQTSKCYVPALFGLISVVMHKRVG